jgi:hypothetical protein
MSGALAGTLVLVFGFALLLWAAARTRIIAVCEVSAGKLKVVRGGLSPRVVVELREVVRRAHVAQATLTVRKEGGRPALRFEGLDDETVRQQLRNTLGRFRLAEILSPRR